MSFAVRPPGASSASRAAKRIGFRFRYPPKRLRKASTLAT
jgi:hypothetical protein